MKKFTFLIVVTFIAVACSTNDLPDETADLEALKSFSLKMEKVWNEGDYESYMAMIDDEAIYKGPSGPPIKGIEAIRTFYKEFFNNLTFTLKITSKEINVFGDYAYSMQTWKGSMNPKDGSTPIVFDNTAVGIYKRQTDNTWKMWRAIYNPNTSANE